MRPTIRMRARSSNIARSQEAPKTPTVSPAGADLELNLAAGCVPPVTHGAKVQKRGGGGGG
eukprot:532200-Hanusia_phi.AAC.1